VIKVSEFRITDRPYAVWPGSYRLADGSGAGEVDAVWFRRRRVGHNGPVRTVACAGVLRDYQQLGQETVAAFLAAYTDGRYGGDCKARWDGTSLWCLADEAARAAYLSVLRSMLAAYPGVPPGYDGWYVFERS
jgi:hypothetical protein